MLFVGFQLHGVGASFWLAVGVILFLMVAIFFFMRAGKNQYGRDFLGGIICIVMAMIGLLILSELNPVSPAVAKLARNPEYKVGVCVETNASEDQLALSYYQIEGTAAPDQLRLTRVGTGHCGVAGPFLSGKVTTVVVSPPDPPATWVIREFTFLYLAQGEPGVRTPRIQSMPVDLSPDGKYRFRVIAADLTDNVPTADIAPVEGDASLLQPPATQ